MEDLTSVLIAVVTLLFLVALVLRTRTVYRKYFDALTPHLQNASVSGTFAARLSGRYSGYDVRVDVHPPSKNSPPYIVLNLFKPSTFEFWVTREGTFTGILKSIHLVKDIEIGDPEFDQKYVLRASDEMAGRMFFGNREVRNAIDRIVSAGYQAVYHMKDKVSARKKTKTFQLESDLRPEVILPALDALTEIAKYVP